MEIFASKSQRDRYYRRLRIKIYCYSGLLLSAAILIVYAIIHLPFLQIKKIETSGPVDEKELKIEVLKHPLAQFLGASNFLSWPSEISTVEIQKDYFSGTLKLTAAAPDRFAIWCSAECDWISRSGEKVGLAPETEGSSIIKISGPMAKGELLSNIVKIIAELNSLPLKIQNYSFNDRFQELTASGAKGEKLIFNARFVPSEKAFAYLGDLISSGKLKNSEYADFTVENRIYLGK